MADEDTQNQKAEEIKVPEESKKVKEEKISGTSQKVGKKLEGIIREIEELSVLELSQLVKALEEKFGVTAAAPMAVAAGQNATGTAGEEPASEQTTFNVILADSGANKISVIKALREINPQL